MLGALGASTPEHRLRRDAVGLVFAVTRRQHGQFQRRIVSGTDKRGRPLLKQRVLHALGQAFVTKYKAAADHCWSAHQRHP